MASQFALAAFCVCTSSASVLSPGANSASVVPPSTASPVGVRRLLPPNDNALARTFTDVCWRLQSGEVPELKVGSDILLADSPGKGKGAFAARDISAGTFLCRYTGFLRNADTHAAACNRGMTSLDYVWGLSDGWVIDAEDPRCSSWGRYINHSKRKQNCQHVFVCLPDVVPGWVPSQPYAVWFETVRDIKEGEELFLDYVRDALCVTHAMVSVALTPSVPPHVAGHRLLGRERCCRAAQACAAPVAAVAAAS